MIIRASLIVCFISLILFSSCAVHETREDWSAVLNIPAQFSLSDTEAPPDRWWESLDDPELNALINQALSDNLYL